jgi:uncharacterized protein
MSEENLQVVRAGFDAFSRGDTPAMLELADPSIVFIPIPDTPDVQSFHGHEGLLQGMAQSTEIWDDFSVELREMRDFDDHVLASCRWWGRGPSSGIEMEADIYALLTLRNGKVVRWQFFASEQQALEAAGVSG